MNWTFKNLARLSYIVLYVFPLANKAAVGLVSWGNIGRSGADIVTFKLNGTNLLVAQKNTQVNTLFII